MKNIHVVRIIALLFAGTVLADHTILAQDGKTEHSYLQHKAGTWNVTMTFCPSAGSAAQIMHGITAERTMIGDYCLHEVMHPTAPAAMPNFTRLADLAYNLNEQRWDYISIDTRITGGIMYFTYQGTDENRITSFITSFPNPGMGPDKKGRGEALYARNVIISINSDHDQVLQYWRLTDKPEWLAMQYDYIRRN
jgi:hypothetical protein